MQIARLFVIFTLLSPRAAWAQSTVPDKSTQHHEKPSPAKPESKGNKEAEKAEKKNDKQAAKLSAKKSDNAQNRVNAQAYKTSVPKP